MPETPLHGNSAPVNSPPPSTPFAWAWESGGYIPDHGTYSVTAWGRLLGVDPRTVRQWIDRYKIPFRQPGKERWVTAGDMLRHMPYFSGDDDEPEG